MSEQKPSVGRIVHYYNESHPQKGPFAAVVAYVHEGNPNDAINLTAVDHNGAPLSLNYSKCSVPFEGKIPGFSSWWSWPPRV